MYIEDWLDYYVNNFDAQCNIKKVNNPTKTLMSKTSTYIEDWLDYYVNNFDAQCNIKKVNNPTKTLMSKT